ncbi:MAG: fibronectin type III domain-containing protein [Candidatus Methylumidiphilus sp.]
MKTYDKNNPNTGAMGLLALLALSCLLIIGGMQPVSANTYNVTTDQCNDGSGSLEWAVQQANTNPGPDIINIDAGIPINADTCSVYFRYVFDPVDYYMITVTDSLTIEGNGSSLIGHMSWVDSNGYLNNRSMCPWSLPEVIVTNITPGFIKVGTYSNAGANTGLTVTVKNLNMSQLNSIARVNEGASLTLDNVNPSDIWSFYHGCGETPPVIGQKNVNVTIKNSRWDRILTWSAYLVPELPGETIAAESGNLTIENSKLFSMDAAAVSWDGTATNKVNIVTTEIFNTGGIAVRGDVTTNFVNSLFYADPLSNVRMDQRFVNASTGPMNLFASTFLFTSLECDQQCQDLGSPGYFYSTQYGGAINFQQSGIGVGWPGAAAGVYLLKTLTANPNIFSADQYTFMQPDGPSNTAAQLQTITNQPLLLTSPPAFATNPPPLFSAGAWASPLSPGVLIGAVPDAGTGGTNELKSPIDNQTILLDVFGTPRVNTTNNTRNIGALQYSGTPVLSLNSVGDGLANLSWTRPPDPPAGPITGYYLYYRVKGNPGQWGVHDIPGPATLHDQITGLTNGQAYEFYVAVVVNSVEQQSSNIVTGTPYGPVGVPVVSGTPGDNQVQLFWTEPATGGHPGPVSYFVKYRVKGQTQWIVGPGNLSGLTTTITGLKGGTEYEFGVAAHTSDGAISPVLGTTTATPTIRSCDVNSDGSVNKTDINLINAARNTPGSGSNDLRDHNVDGVINLYDSRQCVLLCTKPLCAL